MLSYVFFNSSVQINKTFCNAVWNICKRCFCNFFYKFVFLLLVVGQYLKICMQSVTELIRGCWINKRTRFGALFLMAQNLQINASAAEQMVRKELAGYWLRFLQVKQKYPKRLPINLKVNNTVLLKNWREISLILWETNKHIL